MNNNLTETQRNERRNLNQHAALCGLRDAVLDIRNRVGDPNEAVTRWERFRFQALLAGATHDECANLASRALGVEPNHLHNLNCWGGNGDPGLAERRAELRAAGQNLLCY